MKIEEPARGTRSAAGAVGRRGNGGGGDREHYGGYDAPLQEMPARRHRSLWENVKVAIARPTVGGGIVIPQRLDKINGVPYCAMPFALK